MLLSNRQVLEINIKSVFASCLLFSVTSAALVQMRVVKETANYGYFGSNMADAENNNQLVASVLPSNFSGPILMQRLVGKCYNLTLERYKYSFCPFQNFTQYELTARWNAYQGILGIWSHWDIENNTFAVMVHKNGDSCGDIKRIVKVSLQCGPNERLLNVSEPSKCQYFGHFSTRYACHEDALLVYPRLEKERQEEWDRLHTDLHHGEITKKGYEIELQKVFFKAGLAEKTVPKSAEVTTLTPANVEIGPFSELMTCNKEYKSLQSEISRLSMELEALKFLVDLNRIQNRTHKTQRIMSHT